MTPDPIPDSALILLWLAGLAAAVVVARWWLVGG